MPCVSIVTSASVTVLPCREDPVRAALCALGRCRPPDRDMEWPTQHQGEEDKRSLGAFAHGLPHPNRTRHPARLEGYSCRAHRPRGYVHRQPCLSSRERPTGDHVAMSSVEILIVDEADRLSVTVLEFIRDIRDIRDIFDRRGVGVILIGMPGMGKRLSRYPQLYIRVGFAHHYRPLQGDELSFVLTRHWRKLGLALDEADFTDTQAIGQSHASRAATSGSFTACSYKSNASSKLTAYR